MHRSVHDTTVSGMIDRDPICIFDTYAVEK